MTSLRFNSILTFALLFVSTAFADTLRVATYNSLNFRGEQDNDRIAYFRQVIDYLDPDVVAMQEIISESAVDYLLSFAFLPDEDDWAAAQFMDGPDTDNILFYRTSKVQLVSQRAIDTDLRDITEYVLRPTAPDTSLRIRVYSAHLKAGSTESDQQRRLSECNTLRQQLNQLPSGALFVMVGDFNLYTSDEDCYQLLLSPSPDPDGALFDPIDRPGTWSNSAGFADIHTQSPRSSSFGGGSGGGMDDRFDFILASGGLMDTTGTYVMPESYHAVGNDGQHFNQSINSGTNYAVPDSVADALYYASDHLPVAVDIVLRSDQTAVTEPPVAQHFEFLHCYPNPFNSVLRVNVVVSSPGTRLRVYNVLGQPVFDRPVETLFSTKQSVSLDFTGLATGVYIVQLHSPNSVQTTKVMFLR
jgi:endonuclease/exonuclease/phosphatase family metal-dependent hydrolase